ncbi:MAG TPA: hypothetical protein VGV07_18010 [Devosia sp.]|jgi:hypothetical protein|uniref:hypothetical protein n=1 Tax=Devosia sp. TaxID=1871048 RepID=UPI002DDCA0E6|nr:hypothetical protein [Devosia sp.]HEV2517154.1 hypothetical protein [Devosia sp.]
MANITIAGGGGFSPDPMTAEFGRKYPVIRERIYAIDRFATASRVSANALFELSLEANQDFASASRRLAEFESKIGTPAQQPARVIEAQRDEVERQKVARQDIAVRLNKAQRRANIDQFAIDATSRLFARLAASGVPPHLVSTPLPKGDRLEKLDEIRKAVAETEGTLKKVRRAAIPEEEAVARGIKRIDELIGTGLPRFDFSDVRGPSPFFSFDALDDDEARKATPNLLGAVLAIGRDKFIDHLKAEARRHYATRVELALDDVTKRDRITKLEAELLALERIDVELVLALRADNRDVTFRPNTDARALLGVEGVAAPKADIRMMEPGDL